MTQLFLGKELHSNLKTNPRYVDVQSLFFK